MPMTAGRLYDAIIPVCPIVATSVPDANNRGTWTYDADSGATQPQKDAANNVIQTIPIDGQGAASTADFIASFTEAEYLTLQQKRDVAATVGVAKNWDIVVCQDIINMNDKRVQDLKTGLVSAGILTQARADEIFSMSQAMKVSGASALY